MTNKMALAKRWVVGGIVCGILAGIVYAVAIGADFPLRVVYPVFWSFGPLFMVSIIGLYHFMRQHRETLSLQLGTLLVIAAGICVTLMGTMQGSSRAMLSAVKPESSGETLTRAWEYAGESANSIQLGVDLAWDLFLFSGIILLGIAMLKNPYLGKIIGASGILIGLLGLVLNIYTYPTPPGEAGLFDIGPFSAIWFFPVTLLIIINFKKVFKE